MAAVIGKPVVSQPEFLRPAVSHAARRLRIRCLGRQRSRRTGGENATNMPMRDFALPTEHEIGRRSATHSLAL